MFKTLLSETFQERKYPYYQLSRLLLLLLLSRFSRVRLCATPETTAHQAALSMDFPGKSTGVGCHCLLRLSMLGHNKLLPISHILMSKSHYHYIPLSCLPLDLLQTEVPGEFEIQCSILIDTHHEPVRKSSHTK